MTAAKYLGALCCDGCGRERAEAEGRARMAVCAECGVTFPAVRSTARYCSTACRVKAHRRAPKASIEAECKRPRAGQTAGGMAQGA